MATLRTQGGQEGSTVHITELDISGNDEILYARITVSREPGIPLPSVWSASDLPEDMREALLAWLKPALRKAHGETDVTETTVLGAPLSSPVPETERQ